MVVQYFYVLDVSIVAIFVLHFSSPVARLEIIAMAKPAKSVDCSVRRKMHVANGRTTDTASPVGLAASLHRPAPT